MDVFKSLYLSLLPYLACIPIGYFLQHRGILQKRWISKPLLFVLLPILVIDHVLEASVNNLAILAGLSFSLAFLMVIPAIFTHRWIDNAGDLNILKSGFSYFNVAFFGIPTVSVLFGEQAITSLICIYVGTAFYGNIIGYIQVAKSRFTTREAIASVLKIPFTYVIFIALLLKFFSVETPEQLKPGIEVLGTVVSLMGMMIIGMNLTDIRFKSINWQYYAKVLSARTLAAMLITTLLIGVEYSLINGLSIQNRQLLALCSLFPIAANLAVFASFLESQEKQSALLIVFSMLISLVLIPIATLFF